MFALALFKFLTLLYFSYREERVTWASEDEGGDKGPRALQDLWAKGEISDYQDGR